MIRTLGIAIAIGATAMMMGCASVGSYFADRGRDARDIFTVTAGVGLGAKARVGPLHGGLLVNHDVVGLRDSAVGSYSLSTEKGESVALEYEAALIPVPGPYREGLLGKWAFGYDAFMARPPVEGRGLKADYEVRSLVPFVATKGLRPQYYSQIEIVVGLGPSVRLGFNPGEFLDFLLGWATVDIYHDDRSCAEAAGR